jgi:gliding motility-associated lipoprotein GldH
LYLFLNTRLPNSNLTRDTIELVLADVNGKWLGKGFGAIKDNQIPVRNNLIFPIKGEYIFGIEQAMREETLVGLVDIGIRVEQAK